MEILNDAQGIILANAIYIYVYAHTDRKRKKRRVIILSHRGKSDIKWNCLINFCGQIKCASYRITSYRAGQRFCFRSSWRMKWMKWKGKVTCSSGYIYVQLLATGQLHSFVGIRLFFFFFFFWVTFLHRQLCNSILFEAAIFKFLARIPFLRPSTNLMVVLV